MSEIHYIFRDGQTYAIREGKVIAADTDPDAVERQVLALGDTSSDPEVSVQASVMTPSGLQGKVLGKTASVWGDEVTVRLENGRVVQLHVSEVRNTLTPKQASTRKTPVEILENRLNRTYDANSKAELASRHDELGSIQKAASTLIQQGASIDDSMRLDTLVVTAQAEQLEVADAVAALDDVEAYAPPKPMISAASSTTGVSREDASWLDRVVDQMIHEAESQDFTKLMDEGPEALVAEQETPALEDADVTQQIASSFIREKTAGIDRKIADPYIDTFLARVEEVRSAELVARTNKPVTKEAAVEDPYKDVPDDAVFL